MTGTKRFWAAATTLVRLLVLDKKSMAIVLWRLRRGEATFRLDYDLSPDSLVFDVGGYRGQFTQQIATRFDCRIHVFEPVDGYCREIRNNLGGNPKIVVNNFGLSDRTEAQLISVDEAASTTTRREGQLERIQLVDIHEYVSSIGAESIDLIKINIEGGEYALLSRMHETGLIARCRDIQIQFHDFVPDAYARREKLREMLSNTHKLTYDYYFIWENWRLKGSTK